MTLAEKRKPKDKVLGPYRATEEQREKFKLAFHKHKDRLKVDTYTEFVFAAIDELEKESA